METFPFCLMRRRAAWRGRCLFGAGPVEILFSFAVDFVEEILPQAKGIGSGLDEFIIVDVLEGFFEREAAGRGDLKFTVGSGGAHIGQLFAALDIDDEVVVFAVLTDNLAFIAPFAGIDEEKSAVPEAIKGIGGDLAAFHAEQHAVDALRDVVAHGGIFEEAMVENGFPRWWR